MNPSVLYPDFMDRPWYCVPFPQNQMSILVCSCGLDLAKGTVQIDASDRVVTLNFLKWVDPGRKLVAIVGIGQCGRCGAVHWCADDHYALVKLCEAKGIEGV